MSLTQCALQIFIYSRDIFMQSAHAAFQLGQYYDCIEDPQYKYNLIYLGAGGVNIGLYGGFCLPKVCTNQIIEQQANKALIQLGFPYTVYQIYDKIPEYQFPFTWVFYLTIAIIILLVCITLYATLLKSKVKSIQSISLQKTINIFKTKDTDLNVFNGIRALAMMWVVFGHYYFNSVVGIVNAFSINTIFKDPFLLLVQSGLLAVDIFFFLGGFFLAFVFLRQKSKNIFKYPLAIFQRVLRIWPAYILTMMIYYSIFMHLGDGPKWFSYQPVINICQNMWRSIFFIENFINNGQQMCLDWGWYLQVEFQIFIVCIILLYFYKNVNKTLSYVTGFILIVGSWIFTMVYTQDHNQKLFTDITSLQNFRQFYLDVYIKPYARWSVYFMGLYLGIIYFQYQQDIKKNIELTGPSKFLAKLKLKLAFQWTGMIIMSFLTFIPRLLQTGHQWPQIWHSLFGCFQKPLFIIGMTMVIFPTILGYKHSFFRLILDNKLFNFIAKISFCTYLVHLMVIIQYTNSRTYDYYYSIINSFPLYLGCLVVSCFFGFIMTIFIEIPCSVWQKDFIKFLLAKQQRRKSFQMDIKNQDLSTEISQKINRTIQSQSSIQQKLN